MASLKQIEDDRRNAQKSTGPRTPEGKALNSLRHGMRARTVVLPGEDRQEFLRLCDDLEAQWQPRTGTELFYLEQMAVSQWKLSRMEVGEADVYHEVTGAKTQIPLLDRIWHAQCRMERSFARAQRELERIQAFHRGQHQQPQEDVPSGAPYPGQTQPCADVVPVASSPGHSANFPNSASLPPKASSASTSGPNPAIRPSSWATKSTPLAAPTSAPAAIVPEMLPPHFHPPEP